MRQVVIRVPNRKFNMNLKTVVDLSSVCRCCTEKDGLTINKQEVSIINSIKHNKYVETKTYKIGSLKTAFCKMHLNELKNIKEKNKKVYLKALRNTSIVSFVLSIIVAIYVLLTNVDPDEAIMIIFSVFLFSFFIVGIIIFIRAIYRSQKTFSEEVEYYHEKRGIFNTLKLNIPARMYLNKSNSGWNSFADDSPIYSNYMEAFEKNGVAIEEGDIFISTLFLNDEAAEIAIKESGIGSEIVLLEFKDM